MSAAVVTDEIPTAGPPGPRSGATGRAYAVLREAIVQLELRPGALIDKSAIALRLGVSRFPVGEAMNRLAAEGLVDIVPQSGSRVALIRIADARENMFLRRALEAETARAVAGTAGRQLVAALSGNLRHQKAAIKAGDQGGFHRGDVAFHDLLQQHLGFARVRLATEAARLALERVRRLLNSPRRMELSYDEHLTIARAIEAGDGAGAAAAMATHLDQVLAELENFASKRPELFADLVNPGDKT